MCQSTPLAVCSQYLPAGQSLYASEGGSGDGSLFAREQFVKTIITSVSSVFDSLSSLSDLPPFPVAAPSSAGDARGENVYECSQEMLVRTICMYMFPTCDPQSPARSPRPLPLCQRDCEYVASACSYQLDELLEYLDNCAHPNNTITVVNTLLMMYRSIN